MMPGAAYKVSSVVQESCGFQELAAFKWESMDSLEAIEELG
jgi:hypothetical protein